MSSIVLITGASGSGISTISHRVAENFPKSIHLQVDNLRDMMVKGMVPPKIEWSEEEEQQVLQQFQWARSTAIYMAKLYASQGVAVVIDDVITPNFVEQYAALFEIPGVHRVLLYPKESAVIERVKQRGGPWAHVLIDFVPLSYILLDPMPKDGWIVLDSGEWTIEQTVHEVLSNIGVVPGNAES
jgi:predicted kinase